MEDKTCLSIQKTDSNAKQREIRIKIHIKKTGEI